MTSNHFKFKPLDETDLEQLYQWLESSHVKEWWDEGLSKEETKTKYRKRIHEHYVQLFVVYLNEKPLGVAQYYDVNKVADGMWPEAGEGAVGMDIFIGEKSQLEKGIGTEMLKAFIKKIFSDKNIKKIITDPNPANGRAIRCYEKAGFTFIKNVTTPDGTVSLYEINQKV